MECSDESPDSDTCQISLQKMIFLGRFHAQREGVPPSEIDDCQMTFVEQMLVRSPQMSAIIAAANAEAWLHRCAQNHARNYRRSILRRERRCLSLNALWEQSSRKHELVDRQNPERLLMEKQHRHSVSRVFDRLIPEVKGMLFSHYVNGQSAAEIASISGRSQHAVEQALYRARVTVRGELVKKGLSPLDS